MNMPATVTNSELLESALELVGARRHGDAALVQGDVFEVLPALPTGSVDLVFADPPYFLSNGGTTNSGGKRVNVSKGAWDASAGARADFLFHQRWLQLVKRVLRPEGTIWVSGTHHNIFAVGHAMMLGGWRVMNAITWEKPNPPPNLGARCFAHSTEVVLWASPNHHEPQRHVFQYALAKERNGGKQMKDVWEFQAPRDGEKKHGKHSAQKPLALLERIVELTSAPGATVCDPFMGSGTTGMAALRLGRRFVGIERDVHHFDLAHRRIGATAQ